MGTKLIALIEVTRPHSALAAALATLVGAHLTGSAPSSSWLLAATVTWLLAAAGNSFNDSRDSLIDTINRPSRPIPSGRLSPHSATRLAHVCTVTALALAIPLGTLSTVGTATGILLLYGYSLGLRNIPLVGNAAVGGMSAMAIIYGGLVGRHIWAVWQLAVLVFLLMFVREVLKTIPDEAGDQLAGLRTVATVWGTERTVTIVTWGGLSLAILPALYLASGPVFQGRILVLAVVYYGGLSYGLLRLRHEPTRETVKRLTSASKAWLLAILAIMLLK